MFCSHCGSSVKEKDKFCCACGNNIDNMSATSKNIDQSGCSTSHLNFMSQQGVIGCAGIYVILFIGLHLLDMFQ